MAENKFTAIAIILIAVLGFAVYANSLSNKFIWDDNLLIRDNPYIKDASCLDGIFKRDIGEGARGKLILYRPVQMLTYAADYAFWGLNSFGYHLTNIALHVFAAIAVFWFANMLSRNRYISFLTAIFFIAHPVHTEAVAYISGRAESLAAIFSLLSFVFYLRFLKTGRETEYLLTLFLFILSLFSMEYSIILPILFLLYGAVFGEKPKVKRFIPFVVIIIFYGILRVAVSKLLSGSLLYMATVFERLPGFFAAMAEYVRILLLPVGLHMEYGNRLFPIMDPKVIIGIIVMIASILYAVKNRNDKITVFSIAFFYISIIPLSNIYPLNAYMAEHWLYFPSIGFFLLLAHKIVTAYASGKRRKVILIFTAALFLFYTGLTIRQNTFWRDGIEFYERLLKYAPWSARVYSNLGAEYSAAGKSPEAIEAYRKAIKIDPGYANAYNNLGTEYNIIGENEKALRAYRKAISLSPAYANAYNNLGISYAALGKIDEAIAAFKKAIEFSGYYTDAYINLGNLYSSCGKKREAVETYVKLIEIFPSSVEAYNNIGTEYANIGKKEEAIAAFKKAISLKPDYGTAHANLAFAYYAGKEYGLAIYHSDKAVSFGIDMDKRFLDKLKPYRK